VFSNLSLKRASRRSEDFVEKNYFLALLHPSSPPPCFARYWCCDFFEITDYDTAFSQRQNTWSTRCPSTFGEEPFSPTMISLDPSGFGNYVFPPTFRTLTVNHKPDISPPVSCSRRIHLCNIECLVSLVDAVFHQCQHLIFFSSQRKVKALFRLIIFYIGAPSTGGVLHGRRGGLPGGKKDIWTPRPTSLFSLQTTVFSLEHWCQAAGGVRKV